MPPLIKYSKNELEIQDYREKNQTGYFPGMMQSKAVGEVKNTNNKTRKLGSANDKEVTISPGDIELDTK